MSHLRVSPIRSLRTAIDVPGDKSISHRAIIFASLARGATRIAHFLPSEACLGTLYILQALGTKIDRVDETTLIVEGRKGKLLRPSEILNCGTSATSMRLLAGILASQPFETILDGDISLRARPMKRLVEPLTQMGAHLRCEGTDSRPPLHIQGKGLRAITYQTPIPSAQIKSAILLAGLQAEGKTTVTETLQTRNHTEQMLRHFHASLTEEKLSTTIYGPQILEAENITIPGDFSSAAFWICAAAASADSSLTLHNVGLNPTRTGLLNILTRMGAHIYERVEASGYEPYATLQIEGSAHLVATNILPDEIPSVIDELPILAVTAALAHGETTIRGAQELRVKETDRIEALVTNLQAFGVEVEEHPDGLTIFGPAKLKPAQVHSFGDHRIAMAFAILGLFTPGGAHIENTDCIATSYPLFEKEIYRVMMGKPTMLQETR